MPPTNMNVPLKNSAPAITGFGIWTMSDASFGRQASTTSHSAIDHATHRLVTPVAFWMPTRLGLALSPGAENSPPIAQPMPSAVTPPAIDFMLGRVHVASLICWQVVSVPTVRNPDATAAMTKGMTRPVSNVTPCGKASGSAKTALSCNPAKKSGFNCPKHAATM